MEKRVIIINGTGGVGKDTICELVGKYYPVMNVSSIDPIKKIARENGWDGEKTEKSRKFLADLKQLFVDFNDLPQTYLMERYREFLKSDDKILFIHIREPKEIEKCKKNIRDCVTLLIRGKESEKKEWKNTADDEVENYDYDYYYVNQKTLKELEPDFMEFFRSMENGPGKTCDLQDVE